MNHFKCTHKRKVFFYTSDAELFQIFLFLQSKSFIVISERKNCNIKMNKFSYLPKIVFCYMCGGLSTFRSLRELLSGFLSTNTTQILQVRKQMECYNNKYWETSNLILFVAVKNKDWSTFPWCFSGSPSIYSLNSTESQMHPFIFLSKEDAETVHFPISFSFFLFFFFTCIRN